MTMFIEELPLALREDFAVDQWKVRILGPESSPENINCFDDQWTIIR